MSTQISLFTDANVHDVLHEDKAENEEARNMPKWLVQTLCDSKLDALLSSCTRFGSQHTYYASNCYDLVVSSLCDEDEPITFDEAQDSENWLAAIM